MVRADAEGQGAYGGGVEVVGRSMTGGGEDTRGEEELMTTETQTEAATETQASPPALLTVAEVARELRCSVATVYREMDERHIVYRKVRKKRLVHRDDLASYIDRSRSTTDPIPNVPTYTVTKRILSEQAQALIGDDDFEVKPKPRKKVNRAS